MWTGWRRSNCTFGSSFNVSRRFRPPMMYMPSRIYTTLGRVETLEKSLIRVRSRKHLSSESLLQYRGQARCEIRYEVELNGISPKQLVLCRDANRSNDSHDVLPCDCFLEVEMRQYSLFDHRSTVYHARIQTSARPRDMLSMYTLFIHSSAQIFRSLNPVTNSNNCMYQSHSGSKHFTNPIQYEHPSPRSE